VRSIEPSQLLALEVARRALDDAVAGQVTILVRRGLRRRAGSDVSNAGVLRNLLPPTSAPYRPNWTISADADRDSFPGVLSNVIAGRIANRLDLGGANYTVDAACASSLAAVDVACKELIGGTSDLVLCGGVDLHNGITTTCSSPPFTALSPTGRSRTFDSRDGIALGGAACVVLKRLTDAVRDGDRVYAVIKGLGAPAMARPWG